MYYVKQVLWTGLLILVFGPVMAKTCQLENAPDYYGIPHFSAGECASIAFSDQEIQESFFMYVQCDAVPWPRTDGGGPLKASADLTLTADLYDESGENLYHQDYQFNGQPSMTVPIEPNQSVKATFKNIRVEAKSAAKDKAQYQIMCYTFTTNDPNKNAKAN